MDDTLQSGFGLGSGSSELDGDGGGEERLNDGGAKIVPSRTQTGYISSAGAGSGFLLK